MKLNELMQGYLGESTSERDPLQNIVPADLIQERADLPVDVVEVEWQVKESPERMVRIFQFQDLTARNWFLTEILENEKSNLHYGKILIEGLKATIEVQTHDLNRVTELDQEYAAYCDEVWGDVSFIGGNGSNMSWET